MVILKKNFVWGVFFFIFPLKQKIPTPLVTPEKLIFSGYKK